MSLNFQPTTNDVKRVPMACTRCRGKKLKCRVPDGELRCQRCIDALRECIFIPVNFDQPSSTTQSIQGNYSTHQFRLERPMDYTGTQHHTAQPTTSAHHSWNAHSRDTRMEFPQQQLQHMHPLNVDLSMYTTVDRHGGHLMPQQTQLPYHVSSVYNPSQQVVTPNSQWIPPMNYPIQGNVPDSEMNASDRQNVAVPGLSVSVPYGDLDASWASPDYYSSTDDHNEYYSYGSQSQTNSGSYE